MSTLKDALSSAAPTELIELIELPAGPSHAGPPTCWPT